MNLTAKLLLSVAAVAALSTGAMAADLAMPMKAAPMMAPETSSNWDGLYIGATAGYSWAHVDVGAPGSGSGDGTGFTLGGQIGYNFHVADSLVMGVQGNLDWTNVSGSGGVVSATDINYDGALVARLGADMGDWMPYVEAGVAFANIDASVSGTNYNRTHTGWTVGAGVEVMLADNLSANFEYRYTNYGAQNYGSSPSAPATFSDSSVRVGLNYHF